MSNEGISMGVSLPTVSVIARAIRPAVITWWMTAGIMMESAAMYARLLSDVEERTPYDKLHKRDRFAHRAHAVSGVVLAASAVEAYANEQLLSPSSPLPESARERARDSWGSRVEDYKRRPIVERWHPLEKLDWALQLSGKPRLDLRSAVARKAGWRSTCETLSYT